MIKKIALALCAVLSAVFMATGCVSREKESSSAPLVIGPSNVEIYLPDGAPALAMAEQLHWDQEGDSKHYYVVDAQTIQTYVTGENPKADLCILPLNLASKLLGTGETYQMLGTVTHGNLFMLSTDASLQYTAENLEALKGKTVGVVQLPNVPGLTFKVILEENNVPWQELGNSASPAADKVNLKAVDPAQVSPATGLDCYVVPEPAASLKVTATANAPKPLSFVGDLQELYGGEKGYPQAVLVAKKSFIQGNGEWINSFISEMEGAAEWLKTAEPSLIVSAVSRHLTEGMTPAFTEKNLSQAVISHCGIRFETAAGYKTEVNAFLDKMIAVSPVSAAKVAEEFYYHA